MRNRVFAKEPAIISGSPEKASLLQNRFDSLTCRFLNIEFSRGRFIGQQKAERAESEEIGLLKNIHLEESGMFHPETVGQFSSGRNPNTFMPGRYKTG